MVALALTLRDTMEIKEKKKQKRQKKEKQEEKQRANATHDATRDVARLPQKSKRIVILYGPMRFF